MDRSHQHLPVIEVVFDESRLGVIGLHQGLLGEVDVVNGTIVVAIVTGDIHQCDVSRDVMAFLCILELASCGVSDDDGDGLDDLALGFVLSPPVEDEDLRGVRAGHFEEVALHPGGVGHSSCDFRHDF